MFGRILYCHPITVLTKNDFQIFRNLFRFRKTGTKECYLVSLSIYDTITKMIAIHIQLLSEGPSNHFTRNIFHNF